jgi:hypothetical protein
MSLRRIWILVAAIGLLAAPGALAAGLPKVPSYSGPTSKGDFKVKPASIQYVMSGGFLAGRQKPNHKAGSLHWSSWTTTGGRGSGFNWIEKCNPCSGKFTLYPVKLHVWHRQQVRGHRIFTRMTVTYTGKKPRHSPRSSVWKVQHNGNDFFWKYT